MGKIKYYKKSQLAEFAAIKIIKNKKLSASTSIFV